MAGLVIGSAFLSSFGLGTPAVVLWGILALILLARSSMSVALSVAVVGSAIGGVFWAQINLSQSGALVQTTGFEGTVKVAEGPFLTANGQRFVVSNPEADDEQWCVYAGPTFRPHTGDTISVSGRITAPQDLSIIGRAALQARGCEAQLRAESVVILEKGTGILAGLSRFRTDLSDYLMQAAPGDVGALMSGLVTGDDGALTNDTSDAFLSSGTTHITAISGANFAVLTMLLAVLATGGMRRSLWFIASATAVIWLYALMVGLQPSAFRAALLATAVLAARWMGRRPDLLTLTTLLAALQIVLRPQDFSTLAFQLSVVATVALIVVFDGSERIAQRSWPVALALAVVAAQLATLPVLAARIGTMSGVGVIANLIVGPLATLAFPIALLGGWIGRVSPWLGETFLLPATWLCELMIAFVRWSDRHLPGTVELGKPVPVSMAVLAAVCWIAIFWLSGDLRRMVRHGWETVRRW